MVRVLGFAVLLMVVAMSPCFAADTVFRNFVWGVSPDEVMKYETAVFYKKEDTSLFFLQEPDDFRRLIRYDFKDDKLWRGRFEYVELTLPNAQGILDLYSKEKLVLDKSFGEPVKEDMVWKDKTYLTYPQFWGRALLAGDLRLKTIWQTGDTSVMLTTYFDGSFYQLYYTAEKTDPQAGSAGTVLNLPANTVIPAR